MVPVAQIDATGKDPDGKVVEGWGQLDMLGLLTTIGAMVPAAQPEPAKT